MFHKYTVLQVAVSGMRILLDVRWVLNTSDRVPELNNIFVGKCIIDILSEKGSQMNMNNGEGILQKGLHLNPVVCKVTRMISRRLFSNLANDFLKAGKKK